MSDAFDLDGENPAERVMAQVSWNPRTVPPTREQVALVMHALADFTHQKHMLSDSVAGLARDDWERQASGLGRYFHGLGDYLEGWPNV